MDGLGLEIDRQLFITCRLCLEENGVYQIVPSVQEQINYCFGIVVEHFDGLPQLVCRKCKLILNDYSANKKNFIEKQETLKKKLEEKLKKVEEPVPEKADLDIKAEGQEQLSDTSSINSQRKPRRKLKRRNRLQSSSSDSSTQSSVSRKKKRKVTNRQKVKKLPLDWEKKYVKHYSCRICSKAYTNIGSIHKHCKSKHDIIRHKHHNLIDSISKCVVRLDKLDHKPNLTGLQDTVVLRKDKIVRDEGHPLYFFLYLSNLSDDESCWNDRDEKYSGNSSSESLDEILAPKFSKKRMRLDSKSSTDTLFIGDNTYDDNEKTEIENSNAKGEETHAIQNETLYDNTICIDSSESDLELNNQQDKKDRKPYAAGSSEGKNIDFNKKAVGENIIKDIISVCRKKYEAKKSFLWSDNIDKTQKSLLKHKILSIGTKTINRINSNNCTGLLRYLEHKNLKVAWEKKSEMEAIINKETNFVRLAMKHCKAGKVDVNSDDIGWKEISIDQHKKPLHKTSSTFLDNKNTSQAELKPPQTVQQAQTMQQRQVVPLLQIVQHPQVGQTQTMQKQSPKPVQQPQAMEQAVLYANIVDDSNTQKLLNPTPVANPKQLPKKNHSNDTKVTIHHRPNVSNEPASNLVNFEEQIDATNMVMPVITSTTSLAEKTFPDDSKRKTEVTADKPAPRIKVKPVSELMAPGGMMNIAATKPNNIWGQTPQEPANEKGFNIYVPNDLVSKIQTQSAPMPIMGLPPFDVTTEMAQSAVKSRNSDSIILDTVNLPNTKTDSPFNYLKSLLLLHDIHLIETYSLLPREFVCLLKFKVQFKQENKNLTLCLSLFNSDNKFCISVKDGNQINIHIAKMSANWQWEILKVFQGDVTNKILQHAQKTGQGTFEKTKTFLCLLKSINQKENLDTNI